MTDLGAILLTILLVGLGAGLGSAARWGIGELGVHLNERRVAASGEGRTPEQVLPWMTFVANALSCLVLGTVVARLGSATGAAEFTYLLLSAGFCGGLSTLSTAAADMVSLVRRGTTATGIGYLLLTIGVSMLMLWIGLVAAG